MPIRRPYRRLSRAGFTLLEIVTVIAIIGATAALATPQAVRAMRDNRVLRVSTEAADTFRLARSRAMGRGAAVLFRFTGGGGVRSSGLIEVREAIQPTATNVPLPATSCLGTDWTNGSTTSRQVGRFDPGGSSEYAQFALFDSTNAAQAFTEVCFTPSGRAYSRNTPAGAFTRFSCFSRFDVTNSGNGRVRTVLLPCNGAARVAL